MIRSSIAFLLCFILASFSVGHALEKANTHYKLKLNDCLLTTSTGILLPTEIIKLQTNAEIIIHVPDGTIFRGIITKAAFKEKYHFECFGEMHNHPNTGFGFVVTDKGLYGAIVMRDTDTTYVVTFSPETNGYVLSKRITPSIQL